MSRIPLRFYSTNVGLGTTLKRLGFSQPAMPAITVNSPLVHKTRTPEELLRHFSALLTRHGSRGESIVSRVNHQLRLRYGVDNPIGTAVDAIKPVIKYYKSKATKRYQPLALYPKNAEGMALRWIIEAANLRTYIGGRPDIVRGLVDELDNIIQGNSPIFQKRFNTHRNPG